MNKRITCTHCQLNKAEYMYLPCNHICACYQCVKDNSDKFQCLFCGSYSDKVFKPKYVMHVL